jgi:hypothetical protein
MNSILLADGNNVQKFHIIGTETDDQVIALIRIQP